VTVADPDLGIGETTTVTFTFSEAVTGFTIGAISVLPGSRRIVLLCHKRILAFTRRQHGQRGSVLSKAAAIRSRKVVIDDRTW
ncbi:hypothetical protein D8B22_22585, partial [Verminephrobacter aporrectodeae subsp. tuberculatae]|uniref:Ig-like domain-containing protein n=1 Tax=Verminephrobacter aporrectodeae TaxID=1110389 RepID=UPI0039088D63|nr:hypothetical protein [Verminephrobacter aporrectodeae subsp. tuberculatae]MCW8171794.1 hypothetical protein [Verminephrobacter aporrectodeae subsp. tuberculatae]